MVSGKSLLSPPGPAHCIDLTYPSCLAGHTPQHRGSGHHMNVELAWEQDIIGRGAVVSILDDGIEYTHPDLKDSYVRCS